MKILPLVLLLTVLGSALGSGWAIAEPAPTVPPAVGGVDHVGLTVTDLQATEKFFTETLGFEVLRRDPEYPAAFLGNGQIIVTLWRATDPDTAVAFNRKTNVGLHHLAFKVDSFAALDALHNRLKDTPGVKIEFAPEALTGTNARHMMLREPSGNRIEFIHRPPKTAP